MATPSQLEAVEACAVLVQEAKGKGHGRMILKVSGRKPKMMAERMRVLPGVMGTIVQWGDGTDRMPTIVDVKVADMERFITRCRAEIARVTP